MKRIRSKELIIPRVLNKHIDGDEIASLSPDQFVYIGRGSKWGNDYEIGKHGDRDEVVLKYSEWLMLQPHLLDSLDELKGRHLVCFCAPKACHGDILLVLANPPAPFKLKLKKEEKIQRVVTRVKTPVETKNIETCNGKTIKIRVDIHEKGEKRYRIERIAEAPKEDENAALDLAINKSANWSNKDELWHMGCSAYNKETYQQNRDRIRLYYEWMYSYPDPDEMGDLKLNAMAGFFAGFEAGRAYAQDQITPDQIKAWKKQRAKYRKLAKQDFTPDDDIPF